MCERTKLIRAIQIHDFALVEVTLYLDGHPTCRPALAYYEKHRKMREEAVECFNRQFGPLTILENENPDRWTWVDDPWPWEMEA